MYVSSEAWKPEACKHYVHASGPGADSPSDFVAPLWSCSLSPPWLCCGPMLLTRPQSAQGSVTASSKRKRQGST